MTDEAKALVALQKAAGLKTMPTPLTHDLRIAVSGSGPRAYDWQDKPHRLLYDACTEIETQAREIERLRKLTCATWFYMPDEGDCCWFSPHEVIDEMYDPEPGNHVFEVECATSLPSIWCAVRVTDDPDADERFTFTEHATEAEARAALQETNHDRD